MAQAITSWLISDGRFRVHAINAVGRRSARIIEIEDVDTGERFHGSARKLQSMFQSLGSSSIARTGDAAPLSPNQTRIYYIGPFAVSVRASSNGLASGNDSRMGFRLSAMSNEVV